jgi:hypothetical protein
MVLSTIKTKSMGVSIAGGVDCRMPSPYSKLALKA